MIINIIENINTILGNIIKLQAIEYAHGNNTETQVLVDIDIAHEELGKFMAYYIQQHPQNYDAATNDILKYCLRGTEPEFLHTIPAMMDTLEARGIQLQMQPETLRPQELSPKLYNHFLIEERRNLIRTAAAPRHIIQEMKLSLDLADAFAGHLGRQVKKIYDARDHSSLNELVGEMTVDVQGLESCLGNFVKLAVEHGFFATSRDAAEFVLNNKPNLNQPIIVPVLNNYLETELQARTPPPSTGRAGGFGR